MEKVQKVRDLERDCKADIKNANTIISIRQLLSDAKVTDEVKVAAIHSLR
jgi:hypothetical protein